MRDRLAQLSQWGLGMAAQWSQPVRDEEQVAISGGWYFQATAHSPSPGRQFLPAGRDV
jgi:hypothetical protein